MKKNLWLFRNSDSTRSKAT